MTTGTLRLYPGGPEVGYDLPLAQESPVTASFNVGLNL